MTQNLHRIVTHYVQSCIVVCSGSLFVALSDCVILYSLLCIGVMNTISYNLEETQEDLLYCCLYARLI